MLLIVIIANGTNTAKVYRWKKKAANKAAAATGAKFGGCGSSRPAMPITTKDRNTKIFVLKLCFMFCEEMADTQKSRLSKV